VNNGSKLVTDVTGNDGEGSRRFIIRGNTMMCLQPICQATEISKYHLLGPDMKTELFVREVGVLPAASTYVGVQKMKCVSQRSSLTNKCTIYSLVKSLKFTLKYTLISLLHVSVINDNHQRASCLLQSTQNIRRLTLSIALHTTHTPVYTLTLHSTLMLLYSLTLHYTQHKRRSTLSLCIAHSSHAALQSHSALHTTHTPLCTVTLHSTQHTRRSALSLCTTHNTHATLHSHSAQHTTHTPLDTLTLHYTQHTRHSTLSLCTAHNTHAALHSLFTAHNTHATLQSHSALHTTHTPLYTLTLRSTQHTRRSTVSLCTTHNTHSALHTTHTPL